jgi:MFS family permease
MPDLTGHRTRTLWLIGLLHGFTHVYHVALIPLYLLIQTDLNLASVRAAPFLVTAMGLAYFIPSYPLGVMADRFSRKRILVIGLLINGLGFVLLARAPSYAWAVAGVILAGFGGSFYHPAATALVARLYPVGTGRALGLAGVGASVGFFAGPIYSGWRAEQAGSWRVPVLELGIAGMLAAVVFACLAEEQPSGPREATMPAPARPLFASAALWGFFLAAALAFSLRDFGAGGMGTLSSLFLQQAHGFSPKAAGLALSGIFVLSVVSNPLFGHFSDRARLRWICFVLVMASLMIAAFPHLPKAALIPALVVYGFFFLANFPMVEAALMESVPDAARARVFGLFITIAGLLGNLSHGAMGDWVKRLGAGAGTVENYHSLFLILALCVLASLLGLPCLRALRRREEAIVHEAASLANVPIAPAAPPRR